MKKAKVISLVTLSALSSLFVTAVLAVEDAGRVMFVAGKATIVNAAGLERVARKGDFLKQGDRLVTSDKSMIQVKMRDDGVMAVRPNTDLKLNDMVPQLNKTDGPSQALLLSRGGVRVLTGNERNKLGYLIKTDATSIGLRDGDTEALVIPKPLPAAGRGADPSPAGTYNRMNAGTGVIQGATGKDISLAANQISYTPSVSVAPVLVASLPPRYINTTVSLPPATGVKPTIATAAPPPASVPGGMVLSPTIVTPTAVTATGSVVGAASIVPTKLVDPSAATVIGAAPPTLVRLEPPPVTLAPIVVTASLPPPPVMIAPPTLISKPILVMQPVVILPPPPQPVTTVTVTPTTPTTTEPTTPTTTEPLIPTTTKLTTTVISTTGGTLNGTFCIKGQIC